ncbi:ABC transporter substrate-binding protein [Saccharibacillus alkalitolerans]|uniref:ABC transporter substrate-binding protein n=1 Tax=Saccharibacillus alkalitolerans TaxID=2705290 RepID=A0ABX0F356_9BACL|nr:ABC transporter substrate-binding protein [Saccharibacillus alkalitolerans]NGZ74088.1 ABC transporter substrate-binding protein [Saccharibacillus alkalitolerans]
MAKKRMWSTILLTVSAAVLFSGCGSGSGSAQNAAGGGEAGGSGGTLSFYTSQPEEDAAKLVEAFRQKHPDIQVETFRSGTEEVVAKLQAEKQAGQVQADVLLVADSVTFEALKEQDMLKAYKSPEAGKIPSELIDPDGMYAGTKVIATILAANTDKAASLPASWKVLGEQSAKSQAIMPSPLYSGAAAYNVGVFTRSDAFGWDYMQALKNNDMTVIKGNGAVLKAVASGEKTYGMVVDYMVAREKEKGSPIDLVYPEEGVPVITEPIGILKDAKNAEGAEAFVDFVLSEEGQKLAADIGYTPVREGIDAPEGLKSLDEMKLMSADLKTLTAEREEDKKKFTDLFGG